jgi:hypothetical protein
LPAFSGLQAQMISVWYHHDDRYQQECCLERTRAHSATNIQKLDEIATSGIDSENNTILRASRLRRPNLSASQAGR